jgi:hypothetical protein
MAFGKPSMLKRQKEQARRDKQREKAARRAQRQSEDKPESADGVDPDIAGIVPGPQPKTDDGDSR